MKETEVGQIVKRHLQAKGEKVYSEVPTISGRIDIVSVDPKGIITAIELKASASLDVLGQAVKHTKYSNRTVAVFPMPVGVYRGTSHAGAVFRAMNQFYGLGIWMVKPSDVINGKFKVREKYDPAFRNEIDPFGIQLELRDEYLHTSPGAAGGGVEVTPFKETVKRLVEFVKQNEGCSLKTAIGGIKHHYASKASAYNSLSSFIREGKVISGLEFRQERVYLKR